MLKCKKEASMYQLLIVDDEKQIRELIKKYALHVGYQVLEADNGLSAISMIKENPIDLVIMDIMMPELDGYSSVKQIRTFSRVPIIMLSARSEEYDKLYGFDLGIDDYVTKPFSPKELMMRINAVLMRTHPNTTKLEDVKHYYEYGSLKIDLDARIVYVDNVRVDLTLKEYEILFYLTNNANVAVTREQLLDKVWGESFDKDDRTLDTHIKSLRKKIGKYSNNIITIRRVGYRFETKQN